MERREGPVFISRNAAIGLTQGLPRGCPTLKESRPYDPRAGRVFIDDVSVSLAQAWVSGVASMYPWLRNKQRKTGPVHTECSWQTVQL